MVLAGGVRARMAAYQKEIQRKEKARRNVKPVFKVADDLGVSVHSTDGMPVRDKMPVGEDTEMSMSQIENEEDTAHVFQRSVNSNKPEFFGNNSATEVAEEEEEPEKPQEVKDAEEQCAKEKIGRLLGRDEDAEGKEEDDKPIVLQAFTAVQRRYLRAVSKLRPQPLPVKKPEVEQEEPVPEQKEFIRKSLDREMTKSQHLTELTTSWDDYYEKAQDKPVEEEEVKQMEEEVKKVEEEVNNQWADFAEQVVEIVGEEKPKGDDDSASSEDSDMVKWREEARRLKAEAEERKKQKAVREERKKKRAHIAALRKKRAEEAAKKKAEQEADDAKQAEDDEKRKAEEEARRIEEATQARIEQATRARLEEEARAKAESDARARAYEENARKKAEESDSDSSESSDSSSSAVTPEPEPDKKPAPKEKHAKESEALQSSSPRTKKSSRSAKAEASDSESSDEEKDVSKAAKKKSKKKKEKEKDIIKTKEKKKKSKKKDAKKKGDNDSDLEDGWVEEYPRNMDGSLWRNPLKFWTNKPRKLNEVAPKVIMKVCTTNKRIFKRTLARH